MSYTYTVIRAVVSIFNYEVTILLNSIFGIISIIKLNSPIDKNIQIIGSFSLFISVILLGYFCSSKTSKYISPLYTTIALFNSYLIYSADFNDFLSKDTVHILQRYFYKQPNDKNLYKSGTVKKENSKKEYVIRYKIFDTPVLKENSLVSEISNWITKDLFNSSFEISEYLFVFILIYTISLIASYLSIGEHLLIYSYSLITLGKLLQAKVILEKAKHVAIAITTTLGILFLSSVCSFIRKVISLLIYSSISSFILSILILATQVNPIRIYDAYSQILAFDRVELIQVKIIERFFILFLILLLASLILNLLNFLQRNANEKVVKCK